MVSRNPRQVLTTATIALDQARAKGDKPAELKALRQLAYAHEQVDNTPGLRYAVHEGMPLAKELGDKQAQAELMAAEAAIAYNEGRNDEALAQYDRAAAFATENKLERDYGKILLGKARTLHGLERESEALALIVKAHALFETRGDKLQMSNALSDAANIYGSENASAESLARAIDYHRRAIALIDSHEMRHELSTHHHNLGVAYMRLKDYARAKPELEKSLALAKELGDEHAVAFVNYRLGVIATEDAQLAPALAYFDSALPVFVQMGKASMRFITQLGRAKVLAIQGRRAESYDALAKALALAQRMNSPKRDAQYHETAAAAYARLGDYRKAYEEAAALRASERTIEAAANSRVTAELQARFNARQQETENALLRMEQQQLETRRVLLLLALLLMAVLAIGLLFYLAHQAKQNRRFASLAMRDDLTGLPNRRAILEFASIQFKGRRASDRGFALALIDIDHFKAINDEFGHSVGDAVLVAFAQACQKQLRGNDRLGRFGGEEFMLVMAGADIPPVAAVFERLREAVGKIAAEGYPAGRSLTFSLGATAARPEDTVVDAIIRRADEALYRAKHSGRNRFEIG